MSGVDDMNYMYSRREQRADDAEVNFDRQDGHEHRPVLSYMRKAAASQLPSEVPITA